MLMYPLYTGFNLYLACPLHCIWWSSCCYVSSCSFVMSLSVTTTFLVLCIYPTNMAIFIINNKTIIIIGFNLQVKWSWMPVMCEKGTLGAMFYCQPSKVIISEPTHGKMNPWEDEPMGKWTLGALPKPWSRPWWRTVALWLLINPRHWWWSGTCATSIIMPDASTSCSQSLIMLSNGGI